jgi:hypothetical protein
MNNRLALPTLAVVLLSMHACSDDEATGTGLPATSNGQQSSSATQGSAQGGAGGGAGGAAQGGGGQGPGQGGGGGGNCTGCNAFLEMCAASACGDRSELCKDSAPHWDNLLLCACDPTLCGPSCTLSCTAMGADAGCGQCIMGLLTNMSACLRELDSCTGDL